MRLANTNNIKMECIIFMMAVTILTTVTCTNDSYVSTENTDLTGRGLDSGTDEEFGIPKFFYQLNNFIISLNISEDPDDVQFRLYNNKITPNVSHELKFNNLETFHKSLFDRERNTEIIIHGFWTNGSSPMPQNLKNAFLDSGSLSNIIVVHWGLLSTPVPRVLSKKFYAYPVVVTRSIPIVSQRIAEFIQLMINANLTALNKLHVIGHSLGAHIAGSVGRIVSAFPENGGGKIDKITGLDPALPGFHRVPIGDKITNEVANFVAIIFTAAGSMGLPTLTLGHVNFIPNGGRHQPGCVDPSNPFFGGEMEFGGCSHDVVHRIYSGTIRYNITACPCDLNLAKIKKCTANCTESILAGEKCPTSARGLYYFETDGKFYTE